MPAEEAGLPDAVAGATIDAFHRGHQFSFLHDASASHALEHTPAEGAHRAVGDIVRLYGDVTDTQSWIKSTQSAKIREAL